MPSDPRRPKTARRGGPVNGKHHLARAVSRRLALASSVVLACCKAPALPESQPVAMAPVSDAEGSASPTVAQDPPEEEGLLRRMCMRYAELAKDDPLFPPVLLEEAQDVERCVAESAQARGRDPEGFEQLAACIVEGSSIDEVGKCQMEVYASQSGREVPVDELIPAESRATARRMCEGLLEVSEGEQLGTLPEAAIEAFIEECELDLSRTLGPDPEAYERALKCTEGADTVWDYMECIV